MEIERLKNTGAFKDTLNNRRRPKGGPFTKLGSSLGKLTNQKLLPAVVLAGKPVYHAAAFAGGTAAGGPVGGVVASAAANELWNKKAATYAPKGNNSGFTSQVSSGLGNLAAQKTGVAAAEVR